MNLVCSQLEREMWKNRDQRWQVELSECYVWIRCEWIDVGLVVPLKLLLRIL